LIENDAGLNGLGSSEVLCRSLHFVTEEKQEK